MGFEIAAVAVEVLEDARLTIHVLLYSQTGWSENRAERSQGLRRQGGVCHLLPVASQGTALPDELRDTHLPKKMKSWIVELRCPRRIERVALGHDEYRSLASPRQQDTVRV